MPLGPESKIAPENSKEKEARPNPEELEALAEKVLKMIMRDLVIEEERQC